MSLRRRYSKELIREPSSFVVEEEFSIPSGSLRLDVPPRELYSLLRVYEDDLLEAYEKHGDLYLMLALEKSNVDTIEVERELSRFLNVRESRVIIPGTKDKWALTRSLIGIDVPNYQELIRIAKRLQGTPDRFRVSRGWFRLPLVSAISTERPKSSMIERNRFRVKLRVKLPQRALERAAQLLSQVEIPNYFGEQRFGSLFLNCESRFIAALVLQRRYSSALKSLLTCEMLADPPQVREFKSKVRELFFKSSPKLPETMRMLRALAPRGTIYERLSKYLSGKILSETTAKRALNSLSEKLIRLWVSALQSYMWNEMVGRTLRNLGRELLEVNIAIWSYPVGPSSLDLDEWSSLMRKLKDILGERLQLPWKKVRYDGTAQELFQSLMRELYINTLKFQLPKWYTFPSERSLTIKMGDLSWRYSRGELKLSFSLPRGSYATLMIDTLLALVEVYGSLER